MCGGGEGKVNFKGGNRKKADLIKGGIKFGQNSGGGGGKKLRIRPGGIRFLIRT